MEKRYCIRITDSGYATLAQSEVYNASELSEAMSELLSELCEQVPEIEQFTCIKVFPPRINFITANRLYHIVAIPVSNYANMIIDFKKWIKSLEKD